MMKTVWREVEFSPSRWGELRVSFFRQKNGQWSWKSDG